MKNSKKHITPVSLDKIEKLIESIPGHNENAATLEFSPLNPYIQKHGRIFRKGQKILSIGSATDEQIQSFISEKEKHFASISEKMKDT